MTAKSNDQIAFGEVSDHDYLKALVMAGVLPSTVVPGFPPEAVEIEGTGSSEPGFDTAGRSFKTGDPRRDEDVQEAVAEAQKERSGSVDARTIVDSDLEAPVSIAVEDGGPPADPEGSATPDATATEDERTVAELQDELRAAGKPVSGTKDELIARLEEE